MSRAKDLEKLENYAAALGVEVNYLPYDKNAQARAEWVSDGSEITIYLKSRDSKQTIINLLLHELGHHLAWVHKGRPGVMKSDKVLIKHALGEKLTKSQRKLLYEDEIADYPFREVIYNELNLSFPRWILYADIELDQKIYKHYYVYGNWPLIKQSVVWRKELKRKYSGV